MMERYEILLAGSGGQGLMLGGIILAEAAILDGKNATHTQSYGPEARGGASRSEVIVSDDEIDYPEVSYPDLLLAMTQESADKYAQQLKDGGTLIVDPLYVKELPRVKGTVFKMPITETARSDVGRDVVSNIVALGVIATATKVVSEKSLELAVQGRVPKGTEEMNLKALRAGFALGKRQIQTGVQA